MVGLIRQPLSWSLWLGIQHPFYSSLNHLFTNWSASESPRILVKTQIAVPQFRRLWLGESGDSPNSLPCSQVLFREGSGTPLQCSCQENPRGGGAWWVAVHGVAKSRTRLSDFTFTFHFQALEKAMAPHSSVLAWRIPGEAEPGGLPSLGSHRVGHDWSDLAAAAGTIDGSGIALWQPLTFFPLVVGFGRGTWSESAGRDARGRLLQASRKHPLNPERKIGKPRSVFPLATLSGHDAWNCYRHVASILRMKPI